MRAQQLETNLFAWPGTQTARARGELVNSLLGGLAGTKASFLDVADLAKKRTEASFKTWLLVFPAIWFLSFLAL